MVKYELGIKSKWGIEMELIILFLFAIGIIRYYVDKKKYDSSEYKKESGNQYNEVRRDKGKYGEYLSFNMLEKIKGDHRVLTNVYLPKGNGETTEVDLIYIHETGIYVIESKNYSGWIYGSENNKFWTQVLNKRSKNKFYNPIWQNNTHIKYLSKVLNIDEKYMKSIIVFSERCKLKKIQVNSENVKVINRYNLNNQIEKIINNSNKVFELGKIILLYYELKPYTCVSKEEKQRHIDIISKKQA